MEMNGEWTVGSIFEDISDRVAQGRSRAIMGERDEALAILQCARLDYFRFQEVLDAYPGSLSLQQSLETALSTLCEERAEENEKAESGAKPATTRKRGRAQKAA